MSPSASPSAPPRESSPPADVSASHQSDETPESEEPSAVLADAAEEKGRPSDAAGEAPPLPNEPTPEGPPLPSEPTPSEPPLPNEQTPGEPPLPKEPVSEGPPLPQEAPPQQDDGWDFQWDPTSQSYFFYNRFTGQSQWDNPREATTAAPAAAGPQPPTDEKPAAGGYNPAIHGDYDPNAWYAQTNNDDAETSTPMAPGVPDPADPYASAASFNRFTGHFQTDEMGPERHTDEAKSKRQMNAFFDVDSAANAHDGRSLKAERQNKKPNKQELKAFKEKRKARKEEKRRAWLRD